MQVLMEFRDKAERKVEIVNYQTARRFETTNLYKQGYPDSFDEYDLEAIELALVEVERNNPNHGCFLAIRRNRIVGAIQFCRWIGPQNLWLLSYLFVKESMRGRGIGRMLCGTVEEEYKDKARIIFTTHAGFLPDYDLSYDFFIRIGYEPWGELPGYFRDDLSGIFLVKRNPYLPIGWGIPENSGWCPELAYSSTGQRISEKEYREILHSLRPVPGDKWGVY